MSLFVLSFPMIEPGRSPTSVTITRQIMTTANNALPESWNHASLALRACAGPFAAVYTYTDACAIARGDANVWKCSG